MYVCVYIYMYVCMYVCIYVYTVSTIILNPLLCLMVLFTLVTSTCLCVNIAQLSLPAHGYPVHPGRGVHVP